MQKNNSGLTIIILNYNTADWVTKCLQSIQKFHIERNLPFETIITVVDNNSSDNSVDVITEHFPWVKMIKAGQNLGFAGGNNLALRHVDTKYAMLLNSDTEFTSETHLEKIIEYLDQHQEIGVVTPRLELPNGKLDLASHRGEPTPWVSFTHFTGLSKLFPKIKLFAEYNQTYQNFRQIHQIDACSGAAMIVRTSAMQEIGYLDELFFMYAEDLDWCKRFREAGYFVIYFPFVKIIHHKYKSGQGHQDKNVAKKTRAHFYDTMLQYYDKHYRLLYPRFIRDLIKLFINIKKGVV
jgi:N-acetylglucosaminyl-diphospho-decaprenol L-rhamnosyltransferase